MEQRRDSWDVILATMPEPVMVLSDRLRVLTANRAFLETFHVSAEETLNRRIFQVGSGQWNFPEVHRLLRFMLQDCGGQLHDVHIEHNFERIGHKVFRINACRLNEGAANPMLFALHEISDPKYRRRFEMAADGILIMDAESAKITDANQVVTDLFGYDREQLIGLRLWEFEPLSGTPLGREGFERVRLEGVVRFPAVSLQIRHGLFVETEIVGNIIWEGDNQAVQFNLRDITERRQCDRRLQDETRQESLEVLAGGIAHVFNNLLAVIMGNASLALSHAPNESPCRGALNAVITASRHASDLTTQMLAYSGQGRDVLRYINLSEIVREAASLVKSSMPKLVQLEVDLAADPLFVYADRGQMKQLITSLVINGAEAVGEGEPGHVCVTTRPAYAGEEYIRLNIPEKEVSRGTFVVLEVTDYGCGMDPATQARIFDPFFSTKFTGLGLAAALGIVKGHGGVILVDSAANGGTTFRIFLPSRNPGIHLITRTNVASLRSRTVGAAPCARRPWSPRKPVISRSMLD